MALKIDNIRVSTGRKRIDATATFEIGLFNIFDTAEPYTANFRVMSPTEILEGDEERILRQIHHQRNAWQQGKKNQFVRLDGGMTGYVLNYTPIEEQESTQKDEAL